MQIHHSIFGAQTQLVPFGWQYKGWQITFEFKVCFWNNIDFCDNPQNKKCLLQPVCTLSFKWNIKTVGGWIWVQLFFLFLCRVHLSGQPTLTQWSNRSHSFYMCVLSRSLPWPQFSVNREDFYEEVLHCIVSTGYCMFSSNKASSLHWLILVFLCLFVQWSMFPMANIFKRLKSRKSSCCL